MCYSAQVGSDYRKHVHEIRAKIRIREFFKIFLPAARAPSLCSRGAWRTRSPIQPSPARSTDFASDVPNENSVNGRSRGRTTSGECMLKRWLRATAA